MILEDNERLNGIFLSAGRRISDKIDDVRRELRQLEAESLIVTALDDIACKSFVLPLMK